MFLLDGLLFLSFVARIRAECTIHEEGHDYFNISDLGIVAAYNQVLVVDIFIENGCDVNYNGTFLHVENQDGNIFHGFYHSEYRYGRYEYCTD